MIIKTFNINLLLNIMKMSKGVFDMKISKLVHNNNTIFLTNAYKNLASGLIELDSSTVGIIIKLFLYYKPHHTVFVISEGMDRGYSPI